MALDASIDSRWCPVTQGFTKQKAFDARLGTKSPGQSPSKSTLCLGGGWAFDPAEAARVAAEERAALALAGRGNVSERRDGAGWLSSRAMTNLRDRRPLPRPQSPAPLQGPADGRLLAEALTKDAASCSARLGMSRETLEEEEAALKASTRPSSSSSSDRMRGGRQAAAADRWRRPDDASQQSEARRERPRSKASKSGWAWCALYVLTASLHARRASPMLAACHTALLPHLCACGQAWSLQHLHVYGICTWSIRQGCIVHGQGPSRPAPHPEDAHQRRYQHTSTLGCEYAGLRWH